MVHLLFFDTFSHEVNDAPKLDLVQFPKAVQVNEVRVIPLGARVKADFPGGVRLGATNPSQFDIDFFVNDLGKRGAATFENVGQLQYNQQGPIKLDFDKAPPTDGLLLRGAYNTITLAVYGTISKLNRDSQSTPPPPPAPLSPPLQQNTAPVQRDRALSPARPLSSPRSTPAATKRDGGVVVNPPSLPHPLPEKVNPNERIRNWLQDTQIPHSPLDLDCSPTKVWDDPPYDSDLAVGPGMGGKDGLVSPQSREFSLHRSPPHSPPHSPPASPCSPPPSPPHSPSPQQQQIQQQQQQQQPRTTRSSRLRSRERSRHRSQEQVTPAAPTPATQERSLDRIPAHERLGERVHDKSHERSHERSHDRSHERLHNRSHERSHERSYDRGGQDRSHDRGGHERSHERSRERSDHDAGGDRAVKYSSSRDKSSRQRSRERSREQSEHRSGSLARSHNAELWEKEYPEQRESCREYSGSREGSGKEKRDKRGRERRRSREEKRDKRKSLEEFEDNGDVNRRGRYNSPESGHEGGPRTPPPPLPPPPATRRGWRGEEDESGAGPGEEVPSEETDPLSSGSKRRRLDRSRELGDGGVGGDLDDTAAAPVAVAEGGGGALLFGDDMEAISDDEDLPDLPPEGETTSTAVTLLGEAVEEGATALDRLPVAVHPTGGAEFDFEEIMSDEEELPEYQEFEEEGVEEEYIVEEWEDWLKPFTLLEFQCVAPSVRLTSPALTPFQAGVLLGGDRTEEENASKLVLTVESCSLPSASSSDEDREGFVHACELVTGLLPSSLHLLSQDRLKECVSTLCGWADVGLDMDEAMAQAQPIYKIRHLKVGLRLVVCLLQCSDDVTQLLLSRLPLMHRLHHLYHLQHMALSIKLLILRTMDSILSCGAGVRQFLAIQPKLDQTGYEVLLQLLAGTTHTRAKVAASAILRKLHMLEALEKLRDDVTSLQALLPPPPPLLHPTMEGVEEPPLGCEMTPKDGSVEAPPPFMASGPGDEEIEAVETEGVLVAGEGPADDWCPEDLEVVDGVVGEDEDVADDDALGERDGAVGLGITVPRQLITSITSCLKQILHTFCHAQHLLSQPHRYFPVSKQFLVPSCPYDVMQEVFSLLDHADLMGSLASLFTCLSYGLQLEPLDAECLLSREPPLLSVSALLVQLLRAMADSVRGLTYFAAHHAETTVLLRGLLKCMGGGRLMRNEFSFSDVLSDEATIDPLSDPCSLDLQDCSVQLLERLHVHHQLDSLALIAASTSPVDLTQAVVHLNALAGMLLTHHSKMSLVTTLATGDYMDHLYPYLMLLQPNDTAENAPLKVACFGYAVELLAVTVRLLGDMRFMEKHADKLCQIIEAEETREGPPLDESLKLLELMSWLSVARKSETLSYDTIPHLVDIIKDQLEHVDNFPGELFTALRVLRSLTIPPYAAAPPPHHQSNEENNGDVFQELKYKYAVLQLFYADLTSHLNSLLTKLCALFPQPALHTSQLSGTEGACLINLLQPALALLYCLLQQVIQARGATYHDLSSVQPLLNTYLLVSAFPLSSPHGLAAAQLQRKVLQILLLYTQPGHHPDTPCNSNSLWVQMLTQIIKFCEHLPHTMVPGLCLLTELLPLPLPVVGRQLTKEEMERCVVVRNLWAANLSPLAENLYRLLHHLASASQPALTHALRRACIALADLAPQMVVLIVRPLLDLALQYQRADAANAAASAPISLCTSNSMSRIVYMLASLASHSGCKAAILHLFTTEPYNVLLPSWCSAVTQGLEGDGSTPSQNLRQHHAPLSLLMHHLCNTHNNMQGKLESSLWGVPCRELLSPMLECLVAMLSFTSIEHRVLHPLLATLNDAITHDYGLFHLKSVMDKLKGCLHALLRRLVTDIPSSKSGMDAVPTLQGLLELCHGLLSPDNVPRLVISKPCGGSQVTASEPTAPEFIPLRTMSVSPAELCVYVGWGHGAATATKLEPVKGCGEKTADDDGSATAVESKDEQQPYGEEKIVKPEEFSAAACVTSSAAGTTHVEGAAASSVGVVATPAAGAATVSTCAKGDAAQCVKADVTAATSRVTSGVHPMRVLEDVIVDVYCSESVIEQLYSEIVELIAVLESAAKDPQGPVINKVSDAWESSSSGDSCAGVGGGSISQQYEERLICCPSSGAEEPPSFWLQQPPTMDGSGDTCVGAVGAGPGIDSTTGQDSGPDMVAVSLGQLLRECGAGDYDLDASAQKVLRGHLAGGSPQKPAALAKGPAKFKSNPVPLRPGSRGMRPFGFATRGMNLRTDPFRCRPPNTSRPPSLHVDDFVALESTGHQPTGPTGYNRISFGRGKMLLDSMRGGRGGRGMMGRGTSGDARGGPMTGGRFMYRPPMYRPDFNNRGMMNRGMRWNFRGNDGGGMMRGGGGGPIGMNGGSQYRPQGPGPMSGMRFMRGRGMFTRGSPGGYNDRGMRHMRGGFH